MIEEDKAVFLERRSYRRRRFQDAIKVLPVFGLVLWLIPLLWTDAGGEVPSNAMAFQYIFWVWVLLIVLVAVVSRRIKTGGKSADGAG